ncbi:MAG: hypothetical protein IPN86_15600 [Saprospiraceae bacterium]|nr:hypothetical protein [Saprospiraceae bacterium]
MAAEIKKTENKILFFYNRNNIFWIIIFLMFVWYIIIRPEYNIHLLRSEGKETKGRIYRKSSVGSKGTIRCFYNFEVEGEIFEGFYDNSKLYQWDSIEIIYFKKDPNLNQAKQFVDDY